MKRVKIVFWVIILIFMVVIFLQNKPFFIAKQSLKLQLPFLKAYHTPELPYAVIFLVFFLTGFLIAYFFSLYDRFKSKKTIKNLNTAAASRLEELAALKGELEALRGASPGGSTESEAPSTAQTD
jgi:uncharacterized integral membrane protein